ncbi:MAG: HAD hydrolase family protein, partial [Oscillospiraceae bacterium]|nr:HAD hydrolase family protein [Oscillospiraceae bacterium]
SDFNECVNLECIYYSGSHKEEFLRPISEKVKKLEGFSIEYYRDIYNTDFWYLEVCSENASKYNSALKVKKEYGFEKIVAFGDNLNDLPLFKASDECYAVMNAKDEVKAKANGVIPSNNDDGVATFIQLTMQT